MYGLSEGHYPQAEQGSYAESSIHREITATFFMQGSYNSGVANRGIGNSGTANNGNFNEGDANNGSGNNGTANNGDGNIGEPPCNPKRFSAPLLPLSSLSRRLSASHLGGESDLLSDFQ